MMPARPALTKCQTVRYVVLAGAAFFIVIFLNYSLLLNAQYSKDEAVKKANLRERLETLERLIQRDHPSDGKPGEIQKRVDAIERTIEHRLPSASELLITDGRMNSLNDRLNNLENVLKVLNNERKSYAGVDSRIDMIEYRLDKLEKRARMSSSHVDKINRSCEVVQDWQYPFCSEKAEWMKSHWQERYLCFIEEHKMDPFDMCSVLIYLSEVEAWCPMLSSRKILTKNRAPQRKEAFLNRDPYKLMDMMKQDHWRWMRQRIRRLWPLWIGGLDTLLGKGHPVEKHTTKKVFLYMGSFANNPTWFRQAFSGAPLGELVQWSDLMASLTVLGHQVVICTRKEEVKSHLSVPQTKKCPSKRRENEYDIVFTDYVGLTFLKTELGPNYIQYRCKIRILDSFGTEAQFNYNREDKRSITKKASSWGGENLILQQFMTMFPHTPDNTFLGFVVDAPANLTSPVETEPGQKPIGLVYGKDTKFWLGKDKYLETLKKYLDIHGTATGSRRSAVPSWVTNHRIMNGKDYGELLRTTKIYIGLGFPYDGPAPLEAISRGSVFLNGKIDPPASRENTAFFSQKPTSRKLKSQHPYAEDFIGKPYVYTVDIHNTEEVEAAVKKILQTKVRPYIPYEWTTQGMLERVNALVTNQNFCDHFTRWPPIKELQLIAGAEAQSCTEACKDKGLLCEPAFFPDINNSESFKSLKITCTSEMRKDSLHAPSYSTIDNSCLIQRNTLLFSCADSSPIYTRVCPCRDFQPQQVALCKSCSFL